jgi:prevent-host-death family protein
MPLVTIDAFETDLQRLLDRVEAGEDIVLTRAGRPVARLAPVQRQAVKRHFGAMRGIINVGPAFFKPLPKAELAVWEQ